jgi:hypothetical protein
MTIVATAWTLSSHLLIGMALWTLLARTTQARRSARVLSRAAPWAAALALTSLAVCWIAGWSWSPALVPFRGVVPVAFPVLGSLATSGGYLLLHAGSLEACGALRPARAQARIGGIAAFLAVDGLLFLLLLSVLFRAMAPGLGPATASLGGTIRVLTGAALIGGAGFAALLAGLSRKPRPTGTVAAALYVAGVGVLVGVAVSG